MTPAEYRARLKGRRCYVGMDLSSTKDLTAIVAVFPDEGGYFDVLPEFFCPQDSIRERARRDRVPYEQWVRDGYLTATPGPTVNYEIVRARLVAWSDEFQVKIVAYDKWNAIDLVNRLEKLDGFTCAEYRQGGNPAMSSATKAVEKAILSRRLRHDGHPILRWCFSNVSVVPDDDGNLKLSRKLSSEKIDGVVALVMAVDLMDRNSVNTEPQFQMVILGAGR